MMNLHKEAVSAFECGNNKLGYSLMTLSATHGNSESQYFLAKLNWYSGEGIPEMKADGMEMFRCAIETGNAEAMQHLGMILVSGDGIERNVDEGMSLLRMAAEHGNPDGYYCLALLFMGAQGFPQDNDKAKHYLELASHFNHVEAHYMLGEMYSEEGCSCREIYKAVDHLTTAAMAGVYEAATLIASIYNEGRGGFPPCESTATYWSNYAERNCVLRSSGRKGLE
jgi:TPR repeat protein